MDAVDVVEAPILNKEIVEGEEAPVTKPKRVREEIPIFEDPAAELAKLPNNLVKPDRAGLDDKIAKYQAIIDAEKRKVERFSKDMDDIKLQNAKRKQQGGGEMEVVRNALRDIKSSIVAAIEEKKIITGKIEGLRNQRKVVEDRVKAARLSVGSFKSNEAIDAEIERVQDIMHHTSITIKEEKAFILQIKELEATRASVAKLEQLESTSKGTKSEELPALFDARSAKDEIINALKEKETVQVEKLEALKAQREAEMAQNNFSELFDARNKCRDLMTVNITAIKELRDEFRAKEDEFYKTDRLIRELKKQITAKSRAKKQAEREAWLAEHGEDGEGAPKDEEEEEELDENGEKPMDWEIADRIAKCDQLIVFLQSYKPKVVVEEVKPVSTAHLEGARTKGMSGAKAMDDPLGLNAFMCDEQTTNKKDKKNKKKAKHKAKTTVNIEEGESMALQLSLDMMHTFNLLSLPTPVNTDDVDSGIEGLEAKKAYLTEQGKTGIKLKDLLKREKEERNAKRNGAAEAAAAKAKAAEEAAAAQAAAEEEALAKIKAAEEAEFLRKKEEAEAARAKAAAEKQAAEKAALAAAQAEAAKIAKAAEEAALAKAAEEAKAAAAAEEAALAAAEAAEAKAAEKAAKAKAEEKARIEAEKEAAAKQAPKSPKSPDPINDKFEAYMAEQGLDVDSEEEEEEEDLTDVFKTVTMRGLKVQLKLNKDATVTTTITQLTV